MPNLPFAPFRQLFPTAGGSTCSSAWNFGQMPESRSAAYASATFLKPGSALGHQTRPLVVASEDQSRWLMVHGLSVVVAAGRAAAKAGMAARPAAVVAAAVITAALARHRAGLWLV